jgi:hypothetical protein
MRGGCWSRRPTTIVADRRSARRSSVASAANHRRSSTSPGAQRRLNARWRQLKDARRKPNGVVAVAIARELTGYCWEIATWAAHPDPVSPASLPAGDPLTHAATLPPKQTPSTRRRLTNSR